MPSEIISTTHECEIVRSRIVNASREIVYTAGPAQRIWNIGGGPPGLQTLLTSWTCKQMVNGVLSCMDLTRKYLNECGFIKINFRPIAWKRFSQLLFQVVVTFKEIPVKQKKIFLKCFLIRQM